MKNKIINKNTKIRLTSFLLAATLTTSSYTLVGCSSKKIENNPYNTSEKYYICEDYIQRAKEDTTWFCDIWVEDTQDNILKGAKFELRDERGVLIDSWTTTTKAHRLEGLKDGIYILREVSTPNNYALAGSNTWLISPNSGWQNEALPIKNVKEKEYQSNNVNNILNTRKKEYINDKYFVLKLKESYENIENNNLQYEGKLPKYILLKGTQLQSTTKLANSSTIEYVFTDVEDSYDIPTLENTCITMNYNGDGYYYYTIYYSYCKVKGTLTNNNLYTVPLEDLTKEELKDLEEELKNNPNMLDKVYDYININNKTKTLTKINY